MFKSFFFYILKETKNRQEVDYNVTLIKSNYFYISFFTIFY